MNISGNSLLAQMQGMALEATNNQSGALQVQNPSTANFGNMLKDAIGTVNDLQQDANAKRTAFELGDRSVTLAETMIAAQKSSIAFEATVQVRNKFVEAYKEIMSMPV